MTFKFSTMRWVTTLVGAQMLCGIIWVLGPLLDLLEGSAARFGVIAAVLLVWAVTNLLLDWLRMRQENALTAGVVGDAGEEACHGCCPAIPGRRCRAKRRRGWGGGGGGVVGQRRAGGRV